MNRIKDWHIVVFLYLVTIAITISHAVNYTITSDQLREYTLYLQSVSNGSWNYVIDDIVNSCLMITYVPAMIQRILHVDAELWFRIYPCLIYSTLPMFVYLVARRYFNKWYSLLAPCVVLSNFYFLYGSNMGRMSIAWAVSAGLIWALLSKRLIWFGIFGIILIFSHYGTVFIVFGMVFAYLIYRLFTKISLWSKIIPFIIIIVLLSTAFIWHFEVAKESGRYIKSFVYIAFGIVKPQVKVYSNNTTTIKQVTLVSDKDPVIQAALGKDFDKRNIPQKVEYFSTWAIIGFIVLGYLLSFKTKTFGWGFTVIATYMLSLVIFTFFNDYVGKAYGITRVYFTAIPLLAPYFIVPFKYILKNYRKLSYIVPYCIIFINSLAVSGLLHIMFGVKK